MATISYYAINQEILSRVSFPGNNQGHMQIDTIFRLESPDVFVVDEHDPSARTGSGNPLFRHLPSSSLVSCSLASIVKSLDKRPGNWQQSIRIITTYNNVPHFHIFWNYLFNADFPSAHRRADASHILPQSAGKASEEIETLQYNSGCPFFKNEQHEALIIFPDLVQTHQIEGILVYSMSPDNCYVLSMKKSEEKESEAASFSTNPNPNKLIQIAGITAIDRGSLARGKGRLKPKK